MQQLISVIIPTYNREKLILRSVHSVLNQTYSHLELIVVDDGSTDQTQEVLSGINDPRCKIYKTKGRQGANYARNFGVSKANGSLIAFQDSDDVWQVDKLSIQLRYIQKMNVDAVFSSFIRVTNNSVVHLPFDHNRTNMKARKGQVCIQDCLRSNVISTQVLLLKKKVFIDLHGFDNSLKRLQDWDLAIRLIDKYNVFFIPEPLATVYEQGDSISTKPDLAIEARKVFLRKFGSIYKRFPRIYISVLYDYYKLLLKNKNPLKFFMKKRV